MSLPLSSDLPIGLLAACFNSTSATYKFYWFLSIIQAVERGATTISKRELFAGMVSNAWYTVNYFHVSFGKQDKLQRVIEALIGFEGVEVDADLKVVKERLMLTTNKATAAELNYFNNQVPHWFLAPWFPKAERAEIYSGSNDYHNDCLYSLNRDSITINPNWLHYLITNARVLKDFCYWNLTLYLQTKNPNVPDIAGKLIRPAIRNSLRDQRVNFWNVVLNELGSLECIYTGKRLVTGDYAVEHFVPFAFVAHDLIWNLIPADTSFNCMKSDKLPNLSTHFDSFYQLQSTAIEVVQKVNPKNKYLEDYLTILPELSMLTSDSERAKQRYREQLQPLITIAANNGFEYLQC